MQMAKNYFHQEAFVYGIYFAAWIKTEVHASKCVFSSHDEQIVRVIDQGGSIQAMLMELV